MKAEGEASGENQIVQDVVTVAGILVILAAPVAQSHDHGHVAPLRRASTELQALADSGAPVEALRARALEAIVLAENTVAAQMREVVPASEPPHAASAKVVRFKLWPGRRHTSPPPAAATLSDDEIAPVRKSSQLLLAKLAELRQRITHGALGPTVSQAPVAHVLSHRRSRVSMAR